MNHLNRIILINSATVDFYELQLDGNINFIGTQGTGKSTLLRAILFFYNADARKLGISKEKVSFSDYYFPYADSYVVYEVSQGKRNFCIWLYKKQNRLCFRFIDGAYHRELFIDHQRALPESEVIEKSNQRGYKVHRPIYNFTEYRDIIYGANKAMSRFHVLQNPAYQNIPRTISNIFLNSSLDGGFIKTTIINSLSDDPFELNLDANRHHIETARNDYRDVSEYLIHEKKAENIVSQYSKLLQMEEGKKELAWLIGASHNLANEKERELQDKLAGLTTESSNQQEKIDRIGAEFSVNRRRIQDKLSIVRSNIKKANQLAKDYAAKNIQHVLAENEKKPEYEAGRSQFEAQLKLLTSSMKDVENQYQTDKQQLGMQCQQQLLDFERSLSKDKEKRQQDLANTTASFYQKKEQITADHNQKLDEQKQERVIADTKLRDIGHQIEAIQKSLFLKDEQEKQGQKQHELLQARQDLLAQKSVAEIKKENTVKEGERELELLNLTNSQEQASLALTKETLEGEISMLNSELQSLSGSFLEFLEQNKPDWNQSIGKVVSREVLLQNNLQPFVSSGDSLYGVNLNLEQLQSIQISKSELELKLEKFTTKLKEQNKLLEQHQQKIQDQKDKHQKKYNKKIAELNAEVTNCTYQIEKTAIDLEKCQITLNELKGRAELQKRQELEKKEDEKHQLKAERQEIMDFIEKTQEHYKNDIRELESRRRAQESKINSELKELGDKVTSGKKSITEKFGIQVKKLEEQRNVVLKDKGVDTAEIRRLETEIESIRKKLKEIERNYPMVIRYHKDCEEYIDQLDEFRQNRKALENELEHLQQLHNNRVSKEKAELKSLKEQIAQTSKIIQEIRHELNAFDFFKKSQLFAELQNFIEHHDSAEQSNCEENIRKLQNLALEYEKDDKSFSGKITEFSGYFNPDNCLGFETSLSGNLQYRAFAENLKEFVREQKIVDFKTEVTRKYAMVLANIVNETNELLQKEEDVSKVIQRINGDFKKSNFVGVVKSIEMRIQESSNKIIQLLRKIRKFQSENNLNYGEINLFSQGSPGGNNDEAVKLLESLLSQIGQAKTKVLKLEDVFELEFRIRENENDTNWVSRLANVGSNGTDVLVKSMIYINLLHIFKSNGTKQKTNTILHCLIDEVGILHDSNVTGLITFAGERNIRLINGSPNSHNEQDYRHIYIFRKNRDSNKTGITKLISHEL
ncbi:ATP-binding protein [Sunxiuqinia dokdonensis]|uniref:ATP-binding protein n=1 Tax=Sunxiuqinia dokdonensis TaxID=1409788 RepID=A0A0L8V8S8_9BACT|nr:ATP-binding protein [Sunxiuqinia dokdonensis]KOH44849.1 hypothetical protein NC99_22810 [Sunxiuqinia dokdonensis]